MKDSKRPKPIPEQAHDTSSAKHLTAYSDVFSGSIKLSANEHVLRNAYDRIFPNATKYFLRTERFTNVENIIDEVFLPIGEFQVAEKTALAAFVSSCNDHLRANALSEEDLKARERVLKTFCRLRMQRGDDEDFEYARVVVECLRIKKFKFCLSKEVMRYEKPGRTRSRRESGVRANDFVVKMYDRALPRFALEKLREQFARKESAFWVKHEYFKKRTGFFSYVHELERTTVKRNTMEYVIEYARKIASEAFPEVLDLEKCSKVEWWCHNREHCNGHQMHFDSDDEGINGIRHPICSVVLFISADCDGNVKVEEETKSNNKKRKNSSNNNNNYNNSDDRFVGGPTLITTQRDDGNSLSSSSSRSDFNEIKGVLAFPKTNRAVVFDGSLLHCVIPGRGQFYEPGTRTTLMIAFWDKIEIRGELGSIGSARKFPNDDDNICANTSEWRKMFQIDARFLKQAALSEKEEDEMMIEAFPVPINKVWFPIDEDAKELKSLPSYDQCFQGF